MHGDKLAMHSSGFIITSTEISQKMSDALAEEIARASLIFDS